MTTPEGVELRTSLAGIGSRTLALAIDYLIVSTAVSFIAGLLANLVALGTNDAETEIAAAVAVFGLAVIAVLLYLAGSIAMGRGQTIGKRVLRIRVVRDDGGPVGWGRALARTLMGFVDALLGLVIGGLSMILSRRRKRLGDIVAGTLVVREPEKPHGLSRQLWLTGLPLHAVSTWDTTAVSAEDTRLIEDFCGRRIELEPGARASIAASLAARVSALVPAIPAGLHPEAVLEGVILERWQRSLPGWQGSDWMAQPQPGWPQVQPEASLAPREPAWPRPAQPPQWYGPG